MSTRWIARTGIAMSVLVVVAGTAVACSPTDEDTRAATAGLPDVDQQLEAQAWALDAEASDVDGPLPAEATLAFADGALTGVGACNTFRATYDTEDFTVEVGEVAQTLQACPPPDDDAERTFFEALAGRHDVDATDPSRLVLGRDGQTLELQAVDVADELVGSWQVVNVATDDAIVGTLAEHEVALDFEDGTLAFDADCGPGSGRWIAAGAAIQLDDLEAGVDCPSADAEDQQAALVGALERASLVELTPSTLTLLHDDGRILIVATREP